MAFLRRGLYIESLLTFRKNPSPTILHDFTKDHTVKAPSLPITKRIWPEGSMTVEAAVLLPIVIIIRGEYAGGISRPWKVANGFVEHWSKVMYVRLWEGRTT